MSDTIPAVYAAINKVQAALAKNGVGKDSTNTQQGFKFRGVDAVMNAVSMPCADAGLCILPRYLSRTVTERATKSGNALFAVVVEGEFDFVATKDGSKHTVRTIGEAMDSADKATNKAMAAAYKYAVLQAFSIPTEGDNDADAHTHDVAASQTPHSAPQATPKAPAAAAPKSAPQASQAPRQAAQPTSTFTAGIVDVATKSGTTQNGREWTVYRIEFDNGTKASTFDHAIGNTAQSLAGAGVPVTCEVKPSRDGKGTDLVTMTDASDLGADDPDLGF